METILDAFLRNAAAAPGRLAFVHGETQITFGALDQQTRLLMGDELLDLWRLTDATVFLITHSLDEAALLSDRIGVMSARPGVFIDLVDTAWPRERDSRIVSDPAFGRVTGRLWEMLRGQSLKALAGG